ncbi:MAG: GNAT family acetyltransferase [Pseudomonadota bacterium]
MSVTVKPYSDQDLEGIDALWREAFPDDQPRHRAEVVIPAKLAFQPDLLLVARDQDRVVGSVMVGYDGHRGWINRLAVLKARRAQGVGALLMHEAEGRLRVLGCRKINLQVRTANRAVVEFYRSLGYDVEERISMSKLIPPGTDRPS